MPDTNAGLVSRENLPSSQGQKHPQQTIIDFGQTVSSIEELRPKGVRQQFGDARLTVISVGVGNIDR